MPGVEHTGNSVMTALVTGNQEKARELSEMYDIAHTTDYDGFDALLKSGQIDAIYLATPNSDHTSFVVRALAAGIHVLCEKPMAPTVEECQQMIDASRKSGAKLMIAYRLHFEEATVEAIETIRAGAIGEPRVFSSVFCQQVSRENSRTAAKNWAGPLPDMGPYPINAVRQLFEAEPTEVFASTASLPEPRFAEIEEMVSVTLKFPGERLAQFTISYGANSMSQYRVVGTAGDLEISPGFTWQQGLTHTLTVGEKQTTKTYGKSDHFGGETKYFSDCVLDGKDPEPDGGEGLADVRVIKAIEESLKTGQPVTLPPGPPRPAAADARANCEAERGSARQNGRCRAAGTRHEIVGANSAASDVDGATILAYRRRVGYPPPDRCASPEFPVANACSACLRS